MPSDIVRRVASVARATLCACLLLSGGCTAATEPELAVAIGLTARTAGRDSLGFADIGFTVTNASIRAVYVPRCGNAVSADVEQRGSTTDWQTLFASSAGCFSSLWLGPYRLEAGRSVTSSQRVRLTTGEFRLRIQISSDSAQSSPRFVTSDVISIR